MDLDNRAFSSAGIWCIGRLQTDADRARVLDGIAGASLNDSETASVPGPLPAMSGAAMVIVEKKRAESGRNTAEFARHNVRDARSNDAL